jgi:hypothetical protein
MNARGRFVATGEPGKRKWFNSPVKLHEGRMADMGQHIPDFERRESAMSGYRLNSLRMEDLCYAGTNNGRWTRPHNPDTPLS